MSDTAGQQNDLSQIHERRERLKKLTLDEAIAELSKEVYQGSRILEDLEYAGKVAGNGHHSRQNIVAAAVAELKGRWIPGPG